MGVVSVTLDEGGQLLSRVLDVMPQENARLLLAAASDCVEDGAVFVRDCGDLEYKGFWRTIASRISAWSEV
jgi:hypothetical protein